MWRRVQHWASSAFINNLQLVSPERLQSAAPYLSQIRRSNRKDSKLASILINNVQGLDEIMSSIKKTASDLQPLCDAFASQTSLPHYNEKTCVAFHHLLVATLVGYRKALCDMKQPGGDMTAKARKAWRFAQALWHIAYSGMLREHLQLLDMRQLLAFADRAITNLKEEVADGDDYGAVEDHDAEEMDHVAKYTKDRPLTYARWIRLHVSHFVALEILTDFSTLPVIVEHGNIQISILTIRPPFKERMESRDEIIRNAIRADPKSRLNPDAIIATVNKMIEEMSNLLPVHEVPFIVKRFQEDAQPYLLGTIHCEAALASIMRYTDVISSREDVRAYLQVILITTNECISNQLTDT
jgi:hypothetical protein